MTTYYLDNSSARASNSNAGTSADSPFATLAALNGRTFQAGDVISIKAGTTYNGSLDITADGTASAPVTFTSYGTGAKPTISTTDTNAINLSGAHYVVLDGLNLRDASRAGVFVDSGSSNNTVRNMEMSKVGIGVEIAGQNNKFLSNYIHDTKMVNNTPGGDDDYGAMAFNIGGSNNEFGYNKILNTKTQSYDYGTDGGGFETWGSVSNLNIHDNWVENSNGFFEAGGNSGDYVNGITLSRNVSLNNGDFHVLHNGGGNFGVSFGSFKVSYNTIVEQHGDSGTTQMGFDAGVFTGYSFDHNIVDVNQSRAMFDQQVANRSNNVYDGANINSDGSNSLRSGEVKADPKFVSSTDFHLQSGSPADGMGAYAGTTTTPTAPTTPTTPTAPSAPSTPTAGTSTIVVNAKGSAAGGQYAHFKLMVDGNTVGQGTTTGTAKDFSFTTNLTNDQAHKVQVQFDNDAVVNGQDRNLFVNKVTINGHAVNPTDSNVTYDKGTLDGKDVIKGQAEMWWKGTLVVSADKSFFPAAKAAALALDDNTDVWSHVAVQNTGHPTADAALGAQAVHTEIADHALDAAHALALHHDPLHDTMAA